MFNTKGFKLPNIFLKIGSTFILKILGMIFTFGIAMFISRRYGAAAYGEYEFFISSLKILTIANVWGIDTLLIRECSNIPSESKKNKDYLFTSIIIVIIGSILFNTIFLSVQSYWKALFKVSDLFVLCLVISIVFWGLTKVLSGYLKAKDKAWFAILLESNFVPLFTIIILLSFSDQIEILVAFNISIFLSLLLGLLYVSRLINSIKLSLLEFYKSISVKKIQDVLVKSSPFMFISSIVFLNGWISFFTIKYFLSSSDLGIYSSAFRIMQIIPIPLTVINVILAPRFSKSYTNGDFDKLKRYTKIGTTLSILSTLPILIICVYFTEDIIVLLWGEAFKAAVPILYILLAAQLFNVLCGSVGYLAIMTNHEKFVNKTILIAFILNFGLNILLIPKIGLIGAAWGTAIGIVFQNITLFFYMKRKHGFYALPSYSDLRNTIQEKLIK